MASHGKIESVTDIESDGYTSDGEESDQECSDDEASDDSGDNVESIFSEPEQGTQSDTDDDETLMDSGYASDATSEKDLNERFIDNVTDDEYDAGPEETGVMVWRHIAFHIIRSPEPGRPNILLAKITLLHTKGEDKKPRV